MVLKLLTSICFLKNLRTSPKKLTYDNFANAASPKVLIYDPINNTYA